LQRHTGDKGDALLDPAVPQSLFVIGSGVLSFSRQNVEVLRLGPGDHLAKSAF
jgi:hypothetical protein